MWLRVEFRHLAALEAIAREGSFGAAAESLGYVQSAVSRQIAFLEAALEVRLIERGPGTGPVTITAAGEVLLHRIEAIRRELDAAVSEARTAAPRAGRA